MTDGVIEQKIAKFAKEFRCNWDIWIWRVGLNELDKQSQIRDITMPGITIEDEDQKGVSIPLAEVLGALGDRALNSNWILGGIDALGEKSAMELHRLADQHTAVSGYRRMA